MRKMKEVFFVVALALIVNGFANITVFTQDKKQEESSTNVLRLATGVAFGAIPGDISGPVKDAPFSGEMVSETVQILYDGNRIVNRTSTFMYRDSQGRTRNEFTFRPLSLGSGNIEHKSISIFDPVSGVSYMFDQQNRVAHKYTLAQPSNTNNGVALSGVLGTTAPTATATRYQSLDTLASIQPFPSQKVPPPLNLPDKPESLGKQMIEGVEAEGTRSTQIIPAGAMGNDRQIEVTYESWYSPELKMHVLTRTTDPRSGETTQRLTNLTRSEPDPSLFQPPSDYTIREVEAPNIFLMKGESDKKARGANRDSNNK